MLTLTPRRLLAAVAPALLCLGLAGCGGDDGSPPAAAASESEPAAALQNQFVDVVDRVSPRVVQIETNKGLGSGIVYDRLGDVVTNAHVADSARRFRVTLANGDRHGAVLVGSEPSNDLAVIRLSGA